MTPDPPPIRGIHGKAPQGARKAWLDAHDVTCWRRHPDCALARARDLELAHRDHAAGRARLFAAAAARSKRIPDAERFTHLADTIRAARNALEAQHATVDHHRVRAGRASAARRIGNAW